MVAFAAVAAALLMRHDDGEERVGSVVDEGPPVGIRRVPDAYRITYRVETGPGEGVVTTDVVEVRRPFESRLRAYPGTEPRGRPSSEQVSSLGRLRFGSTEGDTTIVARPPAIAASDVRLDLVLEDAVEDGVIQRRETRRIVGRRCQVYRSGALLTAGSLAPPSDSEFADTCVDAAGLVLEELLVVDGDRLVRRVATAVDERPRLADRMFRTGAPTAPVTRGGGSVLPMRAGSRPPGTFWHLPHTPPGLSWCGRFSVIPPQADRFSDPALRGDITASTADVWFGGPDVLIVDQGSSLSGGPPFNIAPEANTIDLGRIGEGEVVLGVQGNEVRALLGGGSFIRVAGTVPLGTLVDVARRLEPVDGGTLEVIEGAVPTCDDGG